MPYKVYHATYTWRKKWNNTSTMDKHIYKYKTNIYKTQEGNMPKKQNEFITDIAKIQEISKVFLIK